MSDANGSSAPKRAVRLTLEVQADSRAEMASALFCLAHRVERGELGRNGVSGGCSSGWIWEYREDAEPSHDQYFQQVNEWLRREKA